MGRKRTLPTSRLKKHKSESRPRNGDRELGRLRIKIEDLTKSIVDLVAARQTLSIEVAREKRKKGIPIENKLVEASLIDKTKSYAEKSSVDSALATEILSLILDASKKVQRREFHGDSIRTFLKEKKIKTIAVVGTGRMGKWFARYFMQFHPTHLILYDQNKRKARNVASELGLEYKVDLQRIVSDSDLIIVAVPISKTTSTMKRIMLLARQTRNERMLRMLELSSVKGSIVEAGILENHSNPSHRNILLFSIHPMFGPDADPFGENRLIEVIDSENEKKTDAGFLNGLFPHFRIYKMDSKTHDQLMAYLLTLPHVLALAFGDTVLESKSVIGLCSSPSFDRMLEMTRKVLSESPEVYFEIQSTNRENDKIMSALSASLKRLDHLRKNRKEFRRFFSEAGNKLALELTPS